MKRILLSCIMRSCCDKSIAIQRMRKKPKQRPNAARHSRKRYRANKRIARQRKSALTPSQALAAGPRRAAMSAPGADASTPFRQPAATKEYGECSDAKERECGRFRH